MACIKPTKPAASRISIGRKTFRRLVVIMHYFINGQLNKLCSQTKQKKCSLNIIVTSEDNRQKRACSSESVHQMATMPPPRPRYQVIHGKTDHGEQHRVSVVEFKPVLVTHSSRYFSPIVKFLNRLQNDDHLRDDTNPHARTIH